MRRVKYKAPSTIRILGKQYEVQMIEGLDDCGECFDIKQLMKIQADMPLALEQDTILHEVVHAIDFCMALKLKERQISALAAGLVCVFRDNPEFARYLFQQPPTANAKEN